MFRAEMTWILALNLFYNAVSSITVNTTVGRICGVKGDDFTSFLGIPYGLVDVNNPFGAADPYPQFETNFHLTQDPEICPQMVNGAVQGSLDCLRLNLYTPNANNSSLPVFVYIHGGSFVNGNGNLKTFSPKFLVRYNIIVVMINYRLGIYGFSCWDNPDFNNQGIKDQKIALQWIYNNIAYFGGDVDNIVLTGLSSGSLTVDYHLLYDNKFIDKVILQSGNLITPLGFADPNLGVNIVKRLGLEVHNKSVVDYIKSLSDIKVNELIKFTYNETYSYCHDGVIFKNNTLNKLKAVKILIGNVNREAGLWYGLQSETYFETFNVTSELKLGFNEVTDEMVNEVKCFYNKSNIKDDMIDFIGDFRFGYPAERSIKLYLDNNATVYRYRFDYDGGRNYQKLSRNITTKGAVHADDLGYEFDSDRFPNITSAEDKTMITIFSKLWTNFAKYGKLKYGSKSFSKTNMDTKPYIILNGTKTSQGNYPFKKRMLFWEQFYNKYGNFSKTIAIFED